MKTFIRVALITFAAVVTLAALFYAEENWRGRRAWETWLRDRAAAGDSLDWKTVVPPPVPDDRNMAAAPVFAELFAGTNGYNAEARINRIDLPIAPSALAGGDWRAGRRMNVDAWRVAHSNDNLAAALAPYDALLEEIRVAAARPECRFPALYEDGIRMQVPHCMGLLRVDKLLFRRAVVSLESGQPAAALDDLRLMARLAEALKTEPTLVGILVRTGMLSSVLQATWEGIVDRRFDDAQLTELQSILARPDLIAHLELAMQGERRFAASLLPELIAQPGNTINASLGVDGEMDSAASALADAFPAGWYSLNLLTLDRFYVEKVLPAVDVKAGHVDTVRIQKAEDEGFRRRPSTVIAAIMARAATYAFLRPTLIQAGLKQATIACAIERYRRAKGAIPERLDQLVPEYLAAIPADPVGGAPLRYRVDGAQYVIYSVGWDARDAGGIVSRRSGDQQLKDKEGDWVWYSAPQ